MSLVIPGKAVFIHIPKTAGTSIRRLLIDHCQIEPTWIHRTASEMKSTIPDWDNLFTFAFIRNPWARAVSTFLMYHLASIACQRQDIAYLKPQFTAYLRDPEHPPQKRGNQMVVDYRDTQTKFITENDQQIVKFVGRYEHLERDWHIVAHYLDVPKTLPHLYRYPVLYDYHDFYDDDTIELVRHDHAVDIERFGYNFT